MAHPEINKPITWYIMIFLKMFMFFNAKSFLDIVKEMKYKKQNIAIEKNIDIAVIRISLSKLMFVNDWNGVNTDWKLNDIFLFYLKIIIKIYLW